MGLPSLKKKKKCKQISLVLTENTNLSLDCHIISLVRRAQGHIAAFLPSFFFFSLFLASFERLDQMLEMVQNYLLKAKKQFNHIYSTSKYISLINHI